MPGTPSTTRCVPTGGWGCSPLRSSRDGARREVRESDLPHPGWWRQGTPDRPVEDGSLHLPPEHGELVAQNHDLDVLVGLASSAKSQKLEESPEHYIEEGDDHGLRIVPSRRPIDHPASGPSLI